jgi:mycofactocin system transcriptional regulator
MEGMRPSRRPPPADRARIRSRPAARSPVRSSAPTPAPTTAGTRGRRPATSRERLSRAALELFARDGYESTTVEDIAAAVGVSRRTFFRYYDSKRDVVWGEFDEELARLEAQLAESDGGEPMMEVLRRAVVATNRFGAGEVDELRIRIGLIATVPTLTAHSAVRYAEWCEVVARFAARRLGTAPGDLAPQTLARAALGAATAAFACWAASSSDDLAADLDRAFRMLAVGFDEAHLRL